MPGKHNILNALGAISLALDLEIPFHTIAIALQNFKGIERRFSYHGTFQGAEIFDDYGHHPKEIACTLAVARKRAKNKLTVLFQPHRYTRTSHLWDDFITTCITHDIDHLIITDIYAASEDPIEHISSEQLVADIKKLKPSLSISYVPYDSEFKHMHAPIKTIAQQDDLVLLLGAGRVNKLANMLV